MSKAVKLYFDLMSQPSRALYIMFDMAKIPVNHQPVALRNGRYSPLMRSKYKLLCVIKRHTRLVHMCCDFTIWFIFTGEHMTDEYKAINKFQKVPCIVDHDGFKLSESIAILRYLDRKNEYPLLKPLYPEDSKTRALVDEFLGKFIDKKIDI